MQHALFVQPGVEFQRGRRQHLLRDFQQAVGDIAEIPVNQQGIRDIAQGLIELGQLLDVDITAYDQISPQSRVFRWSIMNPTSGSGTIPTL